MNKHLLTSAKEDFLPQRKFRSEIQGLRSLAILLVVMYHVWFGRVSGGVDVFLFISAFLLSLSSLQKINADKPLNLVKYWLHVFQRLLPAAGFVVVATLVGSYFVLAPTRWESILADAKASLLYYQNWHLAFSSVDYYAQDSTLKTPLQHFWSLSIQGQIFILWPVLFALSGAIARKTKQRISAVALLLFGTVFALSLAFSIYETKAEQSFAYFDTRTRLWEFAAGTLLAILLLRWKAPRPARIVMGWVGVLGLVTCGWLLPVAQAFPGYLALWPVLSGALVIAAGDTESAFGADRFLSMKPLQKMGAISYCLYLVHWPMLILYTTATDQERLGWLDGAILILSAIVVAWVLHTCIERPLRAWEKRSTASSVAATSDHQKRSLLMKKQGGLLRPLSIIVASLLIFGGFTAGAQILYDRDVDQNTNLEALAGTDRFPGALAAGENREYADAPIPLTTEHQGTKLSDSCMTDSHITDQRLADDLNYDRLCWVSHYGGDDAPLTIVIGDSHSHHTALPIFNMIAQEYKTNVMLMSLSGCRFSEVPMGKYPEQCTERNELALQQILENPPANVVVMSTKSQTNAADDPFTDGLEPIVEKLTAQNINVIGVRDNPRWDKNMFECAQQNAQNLSACGAPLSEKMSPTNASVEVMSKYPHTYTIDFTNLICPNGYCSAVVGNIIPYKDGNHLNRSFAETLAPAALEQLKEQGWDPTGMYQQK